GMHFEECKVVADAIYKLMKDEVNLIFIASKVEYNFEAIYKYIKNLKIDLFLNFQYFRINGGPYGGDPQPTYELLQKLDVPLFIGLRSYVADVNKWREDKKGLDPIEVVIGVTLPELDGAIEPFFVSCMESIEDGQIGKVKRPKVLEDRIERFSSRIKNWLALRRLPNSQKKVAILTYNYPPGEDNLGSSGYLDVFESIKIFLEKLKERGYNLEIPQKPLKEVFLGYGVINTPSYIQKSGVRLPVSKYLSFFNSLPDSIRQEIIREWGEPPGNIMVEGDNILIPGIILGNVFVGVQPSRGVHEDLDKTYHDKELPPHHQYLAYYFFLEKEFGANAVIHFGMHGTLEFTKGKEIALSNECYPDILIGNLPNIYYYWIGNTSEATIAKRRSYAICISHKSPPMRISELYEKYIVLEDLLNQYEENRDEKILEVAKEVAAELHLPLEYAELRKELYKIKRRNIPYGLHIIDRKFNEREVIEYLLAVLRIEREFPSILKLMAIQKGLDWDKIKDSKVGDEIEQESRRIIADILSNKSINGLPEGYDDFVRDIFENINKSLESESLLCALEGKYIFPARGGDPIRDPDVYPSGRAMYAFDPRLIPTVTAGIRGKHAADLLINSYLTKHRRYPETVGIVLWGFESMKTGGDTVATILALLGVRIKHKKSLWFKELEIIPLEELNRPRIDVVITTCGIFRDTLGTHIDLLNRAIEMVANLDEPSEKNYIRKHLLQFKGELKEFALARIFGPSPSEYATSMTTLIESGQWINEKELVKSYDDSMSYTYFRGKVERNDKVFYQMVKSIEIVTQERDNTEYEVTDLDHYYEFLGGLSKSVEEKKGEKAEIMVVDSTEGEIVVEDLKLSLERATRTRIFNPLWIEGMLKHDYHGAKKIKDRVEYLLAFAATTGKVENWIFDKVADRFIFDEEMRKKLQQNNPYATIKIGELLLESQRRGYWKVEKEKIKQLQNIILNVEGDVE
ncbi:MAG: cobaltochelatase subunit CobN, partial [Chitinispirillaceae bacterium]|nr:cobaltochelatase subunit CobN [Chitinispirillaceae bacterium]